MFLSRQEGKTPLLWAAFEGHASIVDILVREGGAEINAQDKVKRILLLSHFDTNWYPLA
jgi:ankyrin repeat protein